MYNIFKNIIKTIFYVCCLNSQVIGRELRFDFNINYFDGAPDGVPKSILGINGKFPGPTIRATIGDILTVQVTNRIQSGEGTSIHWHGLEQYLTPFEDGPAGVTQCLILTNTSQVYQFKLLQAGTFWYHCHHDYQSSEGCWGALIIDNDEEAHASSYDQDHELLITLSDWYHTPGKLLTQRYLHENTDPTAPHPDSGLINGFGRFDCSDFKIKNRTCNWASQKYPVFNVVRGKKYRVRILSASTIEAFIFSIDGHKLSAIEIDGVDILMQEPVDETLFSPAQRYSFIVPMDATEDQYWIRASGQKPALFKTQLLGILRYVESGFSKLPIDIVRPIGFELLYSKNLPNSSIVVNPIRLDISKCQPFSESKRIAPGKVDQTITLNVRFTNNSKGEPRGSINDVIFEVGERPVLYQIINGDIIPKSSNTINTVYGRGKVVDLIVNTHNIHAHPFHLHGHTFWVLGTGASYEGDFDPILHANRLSLNGTRRDTTLIQRESWAVLRYYADNPGVWLFHCHLTWHFQGGMAALLVEGGPQVLADTIGTRIPREGIEVCKRAGQNFKEIS